MSGTPLSQHIYVRRLLAAYRKTPCASGLVRPADRLLAARLHQRGVLIDVVENAFVLATARRLYRKDPTAPPLPPATSLHYFLPVIDELSRTAISPAYFHHLRYRIATFEEAKHAFLQSLQKPQS